METDELFLMMRAAMSPNLQTTKPAHHFPSNLRKFRIKAHLSKKQLADILDVDVSTISNYELGRRCPKLDVVLQISDIFGVTADDLIR